MHEEAHGSLQVTTGRFNTTEDIDSVLKVVPEIVTRLRELSPIYHTKRM
jgi:cysteine desulfurase